MSQYCFATMSLLFAGKPLRQASIALSMTVMPIISLSSGDADALGQQLGNSFQTYGFATVVDHGLDPALVAKAWALTKESVRAI
jgi:hypothetical protein